MLLLVLKSSESPTALGTRRKGGLAVSVSPATRLLLYIIGADIRHRRVIHHHSILFNSQAIICHYM